MECFLNIYREIISLGTEISYLHGPQKHEEFDCSCPKLNAVEFEERQSNQSLRRPIAVHRCRLYCLEYCALHLDLNLGREDERKYKSNRNVKLRRAI